MTPTTSPTTTTTGDPPFLLPGRQSTTKILRQSTTTSLSLLPTFLSLSLLLFSFRSLLENGTVFVTSFIDNDPSLKSLLHSLSSTSSSSSPSSPPTAHHHRRHRRPSFLHLTRVGTLDDDFFSGDDDVDNNFNRQRLLHLRTNLNSSYFPLSGFPHPFSLRPNLFSFNVAQPGSNESNSSDDKENPVDLKFFVVGKRDATALFFLISVLSAAYGWVILGFVITYSWALGIVFVAVVNDFLGKYSSLIDTLWMGSDLGIKRLSTFILMRWAVRDALTQILGLWYFGEIEDQYTFFKLFLRLKLMPFSVSSPWVNGYDREISGFLLGWYLLDTVVSFVFTVDSWVTIFNTRGRVGREIVKEGCYLLASMIHQSIQLKCLELILCGAFTRWILSRVFGKSLAVLFQSVVEVYFMVAWLVFYFAARCKDASLTGRRFGRRELEGILEGLR